MASELTNAGRLARAVLLVFRTAPWTPADHAEWQRVTGQKTILMRTICDLARVVEQEEANDEKA